MSGAYSHRRPQATEAASHQRLADAIGDHIAGQQAAARLIAEIRGDVGDGDELADAIRGLDRHSPAYSKGFARIVQKFLTADAG